MRLDQVLSKIKKMGSKGLEGMLNALSVRYCCILIGFEF